MKILLLLVVICIPSGLFAQENDPASLETVSQQRRLLLDQFRANRLDSVALLLDRFDRQPGTPVLWPAERLLMYYWIERYHVIDSLAQNFDIAAKASVHSHPPDQTVWNVLSYHSSENIDTLVAWVDQSRCPDDVFDFRVQLLETMIHGSWDDQESINRAIVTFISQYANWENLPAEENDAVVSAVDDGQPDGKDWRLGFTIALGGTSLSGNISNYLSSKACLSFAFNGYYQRWYFSMMLQAVFARLERDIPLDSGGVWEAGQSGDIGNFGLACGYAVFDNKWVNLYPFLGFMVSGCTPDEQAKEDDEALRDAGIRGGLSYMYGADLEFKLYNMIRPLKRKGSQLTANIKLVSVPAMFNNVGSQYSGGMYCLMFGVNLNLTSW